MVHAKFADESQSTQSINYKRIYCAVFALRTFRSLREMNLQTGLNYN